MKSIRIRLLVAAMAVVFAAALAKSQSADTQAPAMHHQKFGFGGHMMGFFADYLNLSDAQQSQMKAVIVKEHAALKPLVQQLHQTRQQLRQYEEGAYDEARVRAVAAQESQTLTELTVQKTRIHSELFQMLTPDQQAKMKEFEARHEARIEKRMNRAPSGPPEE
jgi:protein CpxP